MIAHVMLLRLVHIALRRPHILLSWCSQRVLNALDMWMIEWWLPPHDVDIEALFLDFASFGSSGSTSSSSWFIHACTNCLMFCCCLWPCIDRPFRSACGDDVVVVVIVLSCCCCSTDERGEMIRLVSLESCISSALSAHADLGYITCECCGHLHIGF